MSSKHLNNKKKNVNTQPAQDKYLTYLLTLYTTFIDFLERDPQPSNEDVRGLFVALDYKWRAYCADNKLSQQASLLFNREVAVEWNRRMQPNQLSTTESRTPK